MSDEVRPEKTEKPEQHFISIVCPVYNEEESVSILFDEIEAALKGREYEVIFVDDGSADATMEKLESLAERSDRVVVIQLRANCGQTGALSAGFDAAKGDIVVPIDADLQNDPRDIPALIELIDEGYDVVSGWRKERSDPWLSKVVPSLFGNWLIRSVTGVRIHDYGCTLKAYRREILTDVKLYGEMHRFLPALAAWVGARITELPVNHRPRRFGRSKYGLVRTFKVIMDLITVKFFTHFHTKPNYVFGAVGLILFILGVIAFGIVAVRVLIMGRKEATPLIFMMVLFFMASVQCFLMGLLAEVLIRTHYEAQNKPIYFIKRIISGKGASGRTQPKDSDPRSSEH